MMSPSKTFSVVTRPRITYRGEQVLANYLDSNCMNVGMFAGFLHQTHFTSERIDLITTKCLAGGRSPTRQILQEWQRTLGIGEAVPVQTMIQILIHLQRKDAASAVTQMLQDGTFLDYPEKQLRSMSSNRSFNPDHRDGPRQPVHQQGPARYPSVELHQSHPAWSGLGSHQAQRQTSHMHSPQQASFHAWQDGYDQPQTGDPTAAASSQGHQPRNFTKSKLSLESESSTHQLDVDTKSLTWPQRGQGSERHVNPVQDELSSKDMDFQEGHQSIGPLRSDSLANTTATGASPVQIGERRHTTNGRPYLIITYAKKTMGSAIQLGFALKNKGWDVSMDMKWADVTERETFELFQKATYVVVVYNTDYIDEKDGRVQSELHTMYIYRLMENEYECNGRQNMRFIPLIDDKEVLPSMIPSMFKHFSLPRLYSAAEFVCGALREHYDAKKQAKEQAKEVFISRTTYTG